MFMKSHHFTILLAVLALMASVFLGQQVQAHDMWATADSPTAGQPLQAVIGYGHNFPAPEAIPDEELPFFKVSAKGPNGDIALANGTPNYIFTSKDNVAKGTYLVISNVDPIFWTKTPSGWSMKPKNESEGGIECGLYIENAKGVVVVDGDTSTDVVTKPLGLPIEIVPLANPSTIDPGQKIVLQVLFKGEPLPGAKVNARFGAFAQQASPTAIAFSDTTDQEGKVAFVPLSAGDWIIHTSNEIPYSDPASCDTESYGASLFFSVK
jgi:uncharacterized GH25 family protein